MIRFFHRPLVAIPLVSAFALGGMGAAASLAGHRTVARDQVVAARAEQPARVQRALDSLNARRSELSLGDRGGFQLRAAFTNAQGQAVARFRQTYAGYRVWGGEAIAHVLPSGEVRTQTGSVRPGIALSGEPALTAEQARAVALEQFAAKGPLALPASVERVVFPSRLTGGLATRWDAAKHEPTLDRGMSVLARPPSAPYLWAYEVKLATANRQDGPRAMRYVVDGNTGAILHKSSDLKGVDVLPPVDATASTATGHGLYAGDVTLNTALDSTGQTWLWDQARGWAPNPWLAYRAANEGYTGPTTGLMTYGEDHPSLDNLVYQNAGGDFGDGQPFQGSPNEFTANGQTAAVDAQFAMSKTWDLLSQVFYREGPDGMGSSMAVEVHTWYFGNGPFDGIAVWPGGMTIYVGDGTYPADPKGRLSYAETDLVAHELFHVIVDSTAQLGSADSFEPSAIEEAVCDALGEATEAFAYGTPATDQFGTPLIPDDGNDWAVGKRIGQGTPFRTFRKPSRDGASQDNWFDGLGMLDFHFANGPLNRAFYFLAKGSSTFVNDDAYSPYLPGGMAGIGMNSAALIWFVMVTEYLGPSSDYHDTRNAALAAARALFGSDSREEQAVMRAFAAINVGEAPGEAPRTLVTFPLVRTSAELYDVPGNRTRPLVGRGTVVTLHADVANNPDTRIDWKVGSPFSVGFTVGLGGNLGSTPEAGGTVDDQGRWHTPFQMGWKAITAVSRADPLQYAVTAAYLFNMDNDDDGQSDAIDLGGVALSWAMDSLSIGNYIVSPANSVYYAPFVDDTDIAVFHQGMRNAFPVPAPAAAH